MDDKIRRSQYVGVVPVLRWHETSKLWGSGTTVVAIEKTEKGNSIYTGQEWMYWWLHAFWLGDWNKELVKQGKASLTFVGRFC